MSKTTPTSAEWQWLDEIIGSGTGITRYGDRYVITGDLDFIKALIQQHIKQVEIDSRIDELNRLIRISGISTNSGNFGAWTHRRLKELTAQKNTIEQEGSEG